MAHEKSKFIIFTSLGIASLGAVTSLSIVLSNKSLQSRAEFVGPSILERGDGYNLRFKANDKAIKYIVHDSTDYRDGLVLTNADKDDNGYIYYATETVGVHNVSITTYFDSTSFESNELTITNKPMFFYGLQNGLHFYDIDDFSVSGVYSILQEDGTYLKVSQADYDNKYIKNKYNALDFSDEKHVDEVIRINKQLGANIIFLSNRSTNIESNNYCWFFQDFENSVCKRFMDAAWKEGMKCIITDFNIINNNESGNTDIINQRMASEGLREAFLHPAFYGIQFKDEPAASAIHNVGLSVKAIMNYWNNDSLLSNKPAPFIHTCLRSYDENKNEEHGYFEDKTAYKNYIKSWITETGLNYISFDTYTYSSRYYGVKSSLFGSKYYYDPSKTIYDAINEAKQELGIDFDVYQTITGSIDSSRKTNTHYYDVFSSTFLAAGEDVDGYSVYELCDSNGAASSAINDSLNFTDTYDYLLKANKQYRKIQSLLEGYQAEDKTIEINGNYSSDRLYGRGLRTITTNFTKGEKSYQFIANFESDSVVSSKSVTVPSGRIYYLFGYNNDTYQRVGDGSSISINNGEAILISSESASTIEDTSFDKSLLSDYDVVTIRDVTNKESIGNTGETVLDYSINFDSNSYTNRDGTVSISTDSRNTYSISNEYSYSGSSSLKVTIGGQYYRGLILSDSYYDALEDSDSICFYIYSTGAFNFNVSSGSMQSYGSTGEWKLFVIDKSMINPESGNHWVFTVTESNKTFYIDDIDISGGSATIPNDVYDNIHSDNNSVVLKFNYYAEHLDSSSWGNSLADIYFNESWDAYAFSIGCNGGGVHNKKTDNIVNNVLSEKVDNLVEVGAIKIKNSKQTYTYVKVNNNIIIEDVLDNLSYNNKINIYISEDAESIGGVVLKSVDLLRNKPQSGHVSTFDNSGSEAKFKTSFANDLPYNFADSSKGYKIYSSNNKDVNYLSKIDGATYLVSTNKTSTSGATINLTGHYYAYVNNHKYSFYIGEGSKLYFNGTNWISIGELDLVESSITLAYSCSFNGQELTSEHFYMRFYISGEYLDSLQELGTVGIFVSTSEKTKYYPLSSLHEDNGSFYITIDLGSAISENHYQDVFTVGAYVEINNNKVVSTNTTEGSIYSIVGDLYNNESTRDSVKKLYNYLYN